MFQNSILLVGIFITVILVVIILLLEQIEIGNRIQFSILIVFFVTLIVSLATLHQFIKDSRIKQRPFVAYPEISLKYLDETGDTESKPNENDFVFLFTFRNGGLSTAKIEYIKLNLYGAYLFIMPKGKKEKSIELSTMNMNTHYKTLYEDIVLLPNQEITWSTMYHFLSLKGAPYLYEKDLPTMIIAETEIKYFDVNETPYFTNAIQKIFWVPSFGKQVATDIIKSNDKDEPLKLETDEIKKMLRRQAGLIKTGKEK